MHSTSSGKHAQCAHKLEHLYPPADDLRLSSGLGDEERFGVSVEVPCIAREHRKGKAQQVTDARSC